MNGWIHRLLCGLALVVLLAGCRTYGRYGTEAETYDQIQRANELFARELERARADLELLQQAASSNSMLTPYAERYAAIVARHQAFLEQHRALAGTLAEHQGNYRVLHQGYGSILSEQNVVQDQYTNLLVRLKRTATMQAETVPVEGRYQVAPQYYLRLQYANERLTVRDVLSSLQEGTGASSTSG